VGFTCSVCGRFHDERMLDIRMGLPDDIHALPEDEREERVWLSEDFAVLDDERFFVRGLLELPIPELGDRFAYGAWVEVALQDFGKLMKRWTDPKQFTPVAVVLANELSPYRSTTWLRAELRPTTPDQLPAIELADGEHPLIQDQRRGITAARSDELAAVVLHAA
jgi:hypothetical protein